MTKRPRESLRYAYDAKHGARPDIGRLIRKRRSERYKWAKQVDPVATQKFRERAEEQRPAAA